MNDLEALVQGAQADFAAAPNPAELENAKARYLGKSGRVTELLKGLGALPPDEKKTRGAEINQAKARIEAALNGAPRGAGRGRAGRHSCTPRRSTSRCPAAAAVSAACTR